MLPRIRSEHDEVNTTDAQPGIKARVALAAITGERTLSELVRLLDGHPHQIDLPLIAVPRVMRGMAHAMPRPAGHTRAERRQASRAGQDCMGRQTPLGPAVVEAILDERQAEATCLPSRWRGGGAVPDAAMRSGAGSAAGHLVAIQLSSQGQKDATIALACP